MLSKGELPVVPDTKEDLEGIAEHSFSINGDVGLPGRFCILQAEEGHHALGCVDLQSRLSRPSGHFIFFWLRRFDDHVLIAGYCQMISIGTHIGIIRMLLLL